uniref:Integrase catalytic domain-containing protein n=1 Tax=Meloidogyne enterolobii TaxID=390850 RepID=A0A6V7W920_MELEN|nr:unnamed protein product [Meloidogyne enterolobii]
MSINTYSSLIEPWNPMLMVLKVKVFSPENENNKIDVFVFLDCGSEVSYVTDELTKKLKLPKLGEGFLEIYTFQGNKSEKQRSGRYLLGIERKNGKNEMLELLSINKIANELRSVTINEVSGHLKMKDIKDNLVSNFGKPDLLIGVKDFWRFFIKKTEICKGCYLVNTTIGSVICGENQRISLEKTIPIQTHMVVKYFEDMPNESEIKSWWDLQSIGITENPEENEDETAQEIFDKSIKQIDGRYRVKWLWKDEIPDLPTNFGIAYKCLESLLNRLQNDQGLENLKRIDKTIKDQLNLGIIEEAFKSKGELEHYLPHRPVFKDEKIREVYNASARTRGRKSLNDCLFRGPLKLPDLAGMIMRFRLSKFPLLGDIEKAFLQIELEESDREVTKFLWLKDINEPLTSRNLIIYRFTRVAFGIICSPSLLAMTIEHHLKKYPGQESLFKNIYVDNVFIDCNTEEEIYGKYIELKRIFSEGKMNLREFVTNGRKALEKIPENDKITDLNVKVLGIKWNIKNDNLEIKFPNLNLEDKFTRRKVLEIMASLFDPLGLVSPCLVNPKLLFQKLWDKPKKWDEELEIKHMIEWKNILKNWINQETIIPRMTIYKEIDTINQLHVFVDANKDTYAAVVYLRSENYEHNKISLIYSRNRIKPKKQNLTIPRMELLALLIGVLLIKLVQNENLNNFNNWEIFEDENGIKRLKSRIKNSDAHFDLENPIIIPKNSEILPLIINFIHEKFKHAGVQSTLVEFLSKFWTPQARRKVKEVLNRCLKCRKMKSYPFMLPKFPILPMDRTQDIDNQDKKFWITLITCLCTRAVYLEPVKNLKTETCLSVLKRLAARRGCPEKILSDNSKTFIACAKTCKINLNVIGNDLKWRFIKELSPWQGGVYERIVALVKDAFRKTLGKGSLKWEEMITFTTEVEGILNMRPLTAIEENPDIPGIIPLRPVDFLCPRRNLCLDLEIPRTNESINYSIKYKDSFIHTEFLLNELWKRWKKEYLIWLRDKSQWSMKGPRLQTKREPKIGEIVILEEEFVPRNFWKIVKIVELLDTKDGRCVRNVKILMPNGSIISRPINKLYPLELNIENKEIKTKQRIKLFKKIR